MATAIGDEVRAEIIQEIESGCRVRLKTGMKLLLTGCEPPPRPDMTFEEREKWYKIRDTLWWLVDETTFVKARTKEELAKAVPELQPALENLKLLKAPDFFDHLKKEPDMAAPRTAAAPQAGAGPSK